MIPVTNSESANTSPEEPNSSSFSMPDAGSGYTHAANEYFSALNAVVMDERYLLNCRFNASGKGHPEGAVANHILELERNLLLIIEVLAADGTPLDDIEIGKLRLAIHVHDTFKGEAKHGVRIDDPESHASLARKYLAAKVDDDSLLQLIQQHDVPYSLFLTHLKTGSCDPERWRNLMAAIGTTRLFPLFQIIDNVTAGKCGPEQPEPVRWFLERLVESHGSDQVRKLVHLYESVRAHVNLPQ